MNKDFISISRLNDQQLQTYESACSYYVESFIRTAISMKVFCEDNIMNNIESDVGKILPKKFDKEIQRITLDCGIILSADHSRYTKTFYTVFDKIKKMILRGKLNGQNQAGVGK